MDNSELSETEAKDVEKLFSELSGGVKDRSTPSIPISEFFLRLKGEDISFLRSPQHLLHDLVLERLGKGVDEYPGKNSAGYKRYDVENLFEAGDVKFFSSRMFANILYDLASRIVRGKQQNKIYVFKGPPGSGKSTAIDSLAEAFEGYINEQMLYEVVWRLDTEMLGVAVHSEDISCKLQQAEKSDEKKEKFIIDKFPIVPCPNHCNPVLLIPREIRKVFLDSMLPNKETKHRLFTEERYSWVFDTKMCPICQSIFEAISRKLFEEKEKSKEESYDLNKILEMVHVRQYRFDRRLSRGISVFGSGDKSDKMGIVTDEQIQKILDILFKGSSVKYIADPLCRTNFGLRVLMDVKEENITRFKGWHNVVSEGRKKVGDYEQGVLTLLLAVMNPEDEEGIKDIKSFSDRREDVSIPYITDVATELKVFGNIFGKNSLSRFLPGVAENFARFIISSRIKGVSKPIKNWLGEKGLQDYNERNFCDEEGLTVAMDISEGIIPKWLDKPHIDSFTKPRRLDVLDKIQDSAKSGISDRDAIDFFGKLLGWFDVRIKKDVGEAKNEESIRLIEMSDLEDFLFGGDSKEDFLNKVPDTFWEEITFIYQKNLTNTIKKALYRYNTDKLEEDIIHYLRALLMDPDEIEIFEFTGKEIEASESFLSTIENVLAGEKLNQEARKTIRKNITEKLSRVIATTLDDWGQVKETEVFKALYRMYTENIKKDVLAPFTHNENFGRAIKDFGTKEFESYDKKIKEDVAYLIKNLAENFGYSTEDAARQICEYFVREDLAINFG